MPNFRRRGAAVDGGPMWALMLTFCLLLGRTISEPYEWTWMGGRLESDVPGVYNLDGNSSIVQAIGARYGAVVAYDEPSQELWLLGGWGSGNTTIPTGALLDGWKYQPYNGTSGFWEFLGGSTLTGTVPANIVTRGTLHPDNGPGTRYHSVGWFRQGKNECWLFGGQNTEVFGDLWKYDTIAREWAFMAGSNSSTVGNYTNDQYAFPAARANSIGWYEYLSPSEEYLWLFGGYSPSLSGSIGDLWKYNMVNNTWILVRGSNATLPLAVYPTQYGVYDPSATPGGRQQMCGWFDYDSRVIWIYGGLGRGSSSVVSEGWLGDLWKYDIASNGWALMAGNGLYDVNPIRGALGQSNSSFIPGGRRLCAGWWDRRAQEGYIFGGYNPQQVILNDLWRFRANDSTFAWISGTQASSNGNAGQLRVSSNATLPGSRATMSYWQDVSRGEMWFFGGEWSGRKADAWMYQVPPPLVSTPVATPVAAPTAISVAAPVGPPPIEPPQQQPTPPESAALICQPPQLPNSVCINGVWVVNSSIVVVDSVTVVISNPVRVIGNFTVAASNATIAISITSPTSTAVTVEGCVTFTGALNVTIDPSVTVNSGDTLPVATFQGYCGGEQTRFTSVTTNTGCRTIGNVRSEYTDRSLSLVFDGVDNSKCNSPSQAANSGLSVAAIGGIAAAGAAVAVAIVIGLIFHFRHKLIPSYRASVGLRKFRGSTS